MVSKLQYNGSNHNLKKTRGLYEIHEAEDAQWEARRQQINTLSSLSLFHQQGTDDKENETTDQIHDSERPTTPINDSIKSAPKTYAGLSKLIHRRINPRPEWTHISVEDQSSLGAVIMGEVNAVWPVLRRQVADPFLTHQQNKELQRRITIHCVTVCEKLFFHYADKIKVLNNRGIFSNPANISRIRAQLALDTGNYLNILSVRRHIITDIKKPLTKEVITFNRDDVTTSPTTPMPPQTPDHLSFHDLVKSSRPRRKMKYQFNLKAEIQNMQSQMPTLSRSKIQQLRPLTERSFVRPKSDEKDQDDEEEEFTMKMKDEEEDNDSLLFASIPRQPKHRCPSEPIAQHDLLLDEMRQREEDEDDILMRSPSLTQQSRQMTHSISPTKMQPEPEIRSATSLGLNKGSQRHSADRDSLDPKADLKLLILKQERDKLREIELDESDTEHPAYDIPPLIQALTRREAQDLKVKTLKVQEKKLDEQYEEEMKERMKPLPVPQYPQPAVVQTKLPGISNPVNRSAITIRTSDVKINDHVDLSAVTLESYLPIYNDLKDDISQATVKELDANLYQGGELREVYSEIMKTVPNIHQHYDNDPLIATPGSDVDLSKILASSTLIRPRSQQVINPRLRKEEHDMPWEGQQMMWMKNNHPQSAYGGSEASSFSQPLGEGVSAFHRFTPSQLNHPGIEKGSRAYASWLQWWKNTINTDDFFKYISTQDTDFLSVLYHFYDSDAADSDTESMRTAKVEAERERNKKLTILKQEKEEFIPGLWNVKSVTFGGLGKDPEIEEEEFSEFGTPQMTDRSLSFSGGEMKSSIETGSPRSTRSRSGSVRRSSRTHTHTSTTGSKQDTVQEQTLQERLEIVWEKLLMPDSQKLNYALKYSTDKYIKRLVDIVSSWERVTDMILQREKYITNLEIFEKEASDPNRFFEKGHRGSSVMRLNEAKTRASLYKKLEVLESNIKASLLSIKSRFSDEVTYDGRPYLKKMGWDKVEMLYYLQQERRCTMLRDHGRPEQFDLFLHHGQHSTPSILPPTGRRYTQLPINSVNLVVPE